jgi:hypothetical protein
MATVRHLGLFPGCIPKENPIPSEPLLNYGSVKTSMALYWRVKKFSGRASETTKAIFEIIAESEKSLVCGYSDEGENATGYNTTIDSGSLSQLMPLYQEIQGAETVVRWRMNFNSYDPGAREGWQVLNTLQPGYAYEMVPMEIEGCEDPFYFAAVTSIFEESEGIVAPGFRVEEYWPYDPSDGGGPIYDSTTGAQLRSFPS